MFNFFSLATFPQRIKGIREHEGKNTGLRPTSGEAANSLTKAVAFLTVIQIMFFIFCSHEVRTQGIDSEIADLEIQLKRLEVGLSRIDEDLNRLNKEVKIVKSEVERLKKEPNGFFSRIRDVISRRKGKLENRYSDLQELSNRIGSLQNRRELLIDELVMLAEELIDKCDSRMTDLMEVIREASLNGDSAARNAAEKQVSSLWELAERMRETRNRYAPPPSGSEQMIIFPPLRSNDPEDVRLGIAILEDAAEEAWAEAAKLARQIEERQRKQRLLEFRLEIRRGDEERGPIDTEDGNAPIPWGFSDAAIMREIDEIAKEIEQLSDEMQERKAAAERFEKQIEEQQTPQTNAESEGTPEDDL
jgi:archaellum component FlaC